MFIDEYILYFIYIYIFFVFVVLKRYKIKNQLIQIKNYFLLSY